MKTLFSILLWIVAFILYGLFWVAVFMGMLQGAHWLEKIWKEQDKKKREYQMSSL